MAHKLSGYVYFIQAEGVGLIKIGWTRGHPDRRLGDLRITSPDRLVPLGVIRGDSLETERDVHWRFSGEREHGEWFRPSEQLLDYIATKIQPWPEPEVVDLVPTGERVKDGEERKVHRLAADLVAARKGTRVRRADMERARLDVARAIAELEPALDARHPDQFVMRAAMALVRLNDAFKAVGLGPLEIAIPFEAVPKT